MLYAIEKYRNQRINENEPDAITCNPAKPDPKVQLYLTLSMLNYILERKQESIQYLIEAKVAAEFMVQHPKITANINLMERALGEKK
uniref:MYND-type domain-containing protein n=2 Tax=Schistosoma mansoni TaxID=6183 RepID=A0A5K4FEG2_SCHMA